MKKNNITGVVGRLKLARDLNKVQYKNEIHRYKQFHKEKAVVWSDKQDWDQLRDEFWEQPPGGANKKATSFVFRTVEDFAVHKAEGDEDIERWILKSIGSRPMKEIPWQGDWSFERVVSRSKDMVLAQQLQDKLEDERGVFKIAAPIAASYRSWQEIPDRMRSAIFEYLGGSVIEARPEKFKSLKHKLRWQERQAERIRFFVNWMETIFDFKAKVDTKYLDVLGFNKPNMISLIQNVINPRRSDLVGDSKETVAFKVESANTLIRTLSALEIDKAKAFDVPLPDDYQEMVDAAIEVEAREPEEENGNGNGKGKRTRKPS